MVNLSIPFQLLARAAHQNTLLLQRADKLQNPADIVNGSATDLLGTFHYDLRTDPVAGEQFLQQCTIFLITDQMATAYATATGLHCPTQEAHRAGAVIAFLFLQLNTSLSFVRKQLGNNIAVIVGDTLRGAKPIIFSAFSLIANCVATSSDVRLKLSPVTETATGPISTIAPLSNWR